MNIDEVMARLERGDVLMIDDQLRSYISLEATDRPDRFVMRSIYANMEDLAFRYDQQRFLKYEEKRSNSLAELLLSLMDWEWRAKSS